VCPKTKEIQTEKKKRMTRYSAVERNRNRHSYRAREARFRLREKKKRQLRDNSSSDDGKELLPRTKERPFANEKK